MAKIDPVREARRALLRAQRARHHLNQLPDAFRAVIFSGFPHQEERIVALSPESLDALLQAIIAVEATHDRLSYLLAQAQPMEPKRRQARGAAKCNS